MNTPKSRDVYGDRMHRVTEYIDQHIDQLAMKYTGKAYAHRQPGEVRVIYKIEPQGAHAMG